MPPRRADAQPEPAWARWNDQRLLALRFKDLGLTLEHAPVERHVRALQDELAARGLRYRPPVWLSDEWSSSPDAPGIAIPFYLAHPRLRRLERKQMFDVEGGTPRSCMRLLRHEAGHAIQFAYRLHRRRLWQRTFGRHTAPYPDAYRPKPYSRSHVLHLDGFYAQAHPDEDFAETFAVWLTPNYPWRRRYAGWLALKKLEAVDTLMREIADRAPVLRTRARDRTLPSLTHTLGEHYSARKARYGLDRPDVYDRDLRRLFAERADAPDAPPAAHFLRRARREMLDTVVRWTGQYAFTVNDLYDLIIVRSRQLDLRVPPARDEHDLRRELAAMLSVQTMHHLQKGGRWLVV